jgi:hypothetical protein
LELFARFIPEEIGTLIHLRYLKIIYDSKFYIPDSIGNLKNLETLAITRYISYGVNDEDAAVLPGSIIKLTSLRNLQGNVSLPNNFPLVTAWSSLQVLSINTRSSSSQIVHFIVEGKLPNLRKLGLLCDRRLARIDFKATSPSVHPLSHLQTLNISSIGRWTLLPNSIPETITKISLRQVLLDNSGMEVLEKLPKLLILKLKGCLDYCQDLHFHARSFPQLQFLKLEEEVIGNWIQDEGAMASLRHLVIDACEINTIHSSDLRNSIALREVEVFRCESNMTNMFQRLQMELGFKLHTGIYTIIFSF